MVRHLARGRRVRHWTTRREGTVVERTNARSHGYYQYIVRWDGEDHDSGQYGIRELELLYPAFSRAGTPSEDTYTNPAMWEQVRLDSGAYVWVFLCASDEAEPWNLAPAGTPSEDTG